ncbi:uncharacterized protein LOC127260321 [Andrographis paniculata]|uniref:uncharacterized protein LOC127260321 n=1 Tax=Andrographis paniculata TaxID=175694 RepID=UPI0021E7E4B7|nr:uncharacterized protein LOC127260321 [Andrographis paniculata]
MEVAQENFSSGGQGNYATAAKHVSKVIDSRVKETLVVVEAAAPMWPRPKSNGSSGRNVTKVNWSERVHIPITIFYNECSVVIHFIITLGTWRKLSDTLRQCAAGRGGGDGIEVHIRQGDYEGKAMIVLWVTVDEQDSSTVLYWAEKSNERKKKKKAEGKGIWGRVTTQSRNLHIMRRIRRRGRLCCLLAIFLMLIGMISLTIGGGIHGGGLWRGVWLSNPGFRLLEIMRPISILKLAKRNHSSLISIIITSLTKHQRAPNHFGTLFNTYHSSGFLFSIRSVNKQNAIAKLVKMACDYLFVILFCSLLKGKYTPQYTWLEEELPKVNRSETPWLIVLMHSPWYNSYNYHYMEGETVKVMYEPWFVKYKVDVVFAGHVHAYERSVCCIKQPQIDCFDSHSSIKISFISLYRPIGPCLHNHRRWGKSRRPRYQHDRATAEILGVPGGELRTCNIRYKEQDTRVLQLAPEPRWGRGGSQLHVVLQQGIHDFGYILSRKDSLGLYDISTLLTPRVTRNSYEDKTKQHSDFS